VAEIEKTRYDFCKSHFSKGVADERGRGIKKIRKTRMKKSPFNSPFKKGRRYKSKARESLLEIV
jgi:hypothetical protein